MFCYFRFVFCCSSFSFDDCRECLNWLSSTSRHHECLNWLSSTSRHHECLNWLSSTSRHHAYRFGKWSYINSVLFIMNQTALQLRHLGGYAKRAVKSYSLSLRSKHKKVQTNAYLFWQDTQCANFAGNPLRQATKRHLTDKRLKTMKNERKTTNKNNLPGFGWVFVACSVFGRLLACVKGAVILLESGE